MEKTDRRRSAQIKEQAARIEALTAKVVWLQEQVFARHWHKGKKPRRKRRQMLSIRPMPLSKKKLLLERKPVRCDSYMYGIQVGTEKDEKQR